jgi:hypothetical protein
VARAAARCPNSLWPGREVPPPGQSIMTPGSIKMVAAMILAGNGWFGNPGSLVLDGFRSLAGEVTDQPRIIPCSQEFELGRFSQAVGLGTARPDELVFANLFTVVDGRALAAGARMTTATTRPRRTSPRYQPWDGGRRVLHRLTRCRKRSLESDKTSRGPQRSDLSSNHLRQVTPNSVTCTSRTCTRPGPALEVLGS